MISKPTQPVRDGIYNQQSLSSSSENEELCSKHKLVYVAMDNVTKKFLCNACIYEQESINITFLANTAKKILEKVESTHQANVKKLQKAREISLAPTVEKMEAKSKKRIEDLRGKVWSCQGSLLDSFKANKDITELEDILNSITKFLDPRETKVFQDEARDVEVMTKNGNFAYICNKKKFYDDAYKIMAEVTRLCNMYSDRGSKLAEKVVSFKLDKKALQKILEQKYNERMKSLNLPPFPKRNVALNLDKKGVEMKDASNKEFVKAQLKDNNIDLKKDHPRPLITSNLFPDSETANRSMEMAPSPSPSPVSRPQQVNIVSQISNPSLNSPKKKLTLAQRMKNRVGKPIRSMAQSKYNLTKIGTKEPGIPVTKEFLEGDTCNLTEFVIADKTGRVVTKIGHIPTSLEELPLSIPILLDEENNISRISYELVPGSQNVKFMSEYLEEVGSPAPMPECFSMLLKDIHNCSQIYLKRKMVQASSKDRYANVTVRDKNIINMNQTSAMPPPPPRKKSISNPGSKKKQGLSRTLGTLQAAFQKNEEAKTMKSPVRDLSSGNCGSQMMTNKNQPTASQSPSAAKPVTQIQENNVISNTGLGSSSLFKNPPPVNAKIAENKSAGEEVDLCQLKNVQQDVQQISNPVAPPNSQDDTIQASKDTSAVSMLQQNLKEITPSFIENKRMRKEDTQAQPGPKTAVDLSKDVIMIDPPTGQKDPKIVGEKNGQANAIEIDPPTSMSASKNAPIDITGSTSAISQNNTSASKGPKSSEVIDLDGNSGQSKQPTTVQQRIAEFQPVQRQMPSSIQQPIQRQGVHNTANKIEEEKKIGSPKVSKPFSPSSCRTDLKHLLEMKGRSILAWDLAEKTVEEKNGMFEKVVKPVMKKMYTIAFPEPVNQSFVQIDNDRAVILGGTKDITGQTFYKTVFMFDHKKALPIRFKRINDMSEPRLFPGICLSQDKKRIYIAGGTSKYRC